MMTEQEYVNWVKQTGIAKCPQCGAMADHLYYREMYYEPPSWHQHIICNVCHVEWREVFQLVGFVLSTPKPAV